MSNSTHRVNVVKIEEILPCPNADNLGIVYIGGYQCVVQNVSHFQYFFSIGQTF